MAVKRKAKREVGGGKLGRTEIITVRLDPKLRYLTELAARKHRRTLSSFIEWAVAQQPGQVKLNDHSIAEEANQLWDVDEADRFAKLAFRHPELLTHSEQVLWKLIQGTMTLWRFKRVADDGDIGSYYC